MSTAAGTQDHLAARHRKHDAEIRAAAQRAAGLIRPGVIVGLGSGAELTAGLPAGAGVAEVGLFCGLATDLTIATPSRVDHQERPRP
ncbi:hypothetical protein [Streptomyces sp. NPDC047453]|uniref:hypothetical protein n=1 Tax=Streptomyces sp. NPDC047453 TaxID=3154812 RepID=UPI0033EAD211